MDARIRSASLAFSRLHVKSWGHVLCYEVRCRTVFKDVIECLEGLELRMFGCLTSWCLDTIVVTLQ